MKHKLLNKLWLRVGMIVAVMTTALAGTAWAQTQYTLTINASDFNTTSYNANNGDHTKTAVKVGDPSTTMSVTWNSNQVMKNGDNMQWQKNKGIIYNKTDLGTINSVTVNSSAGTFTTYYGTEQNPTSGTTVGNGFFSTKVGNATGTTSSIVITFTVGVALNPNDLTLSPNALSFDLGGTTSAQITNTGQANGAITWTSNNPTVATVDGSGNVTAVEVGTAVITATQAESSTYQGGTATCTVTVADSRYTISDLTFTSACGGSGTADDGNTWTITSDGSESTFDNTSGIHYGTNSANVTYLQLSLSSNTGTIKKILVNARDAQATATISVTVGSTSFTCTGSTTATNTSSDYVFTGSAKGEIVVRVDRGESMQKAIYVKSIVVYYEPNTDPEISADDVDITYDAISGSIAYTLSNATGNVTATITDGDWLTLGTITSSEVPFTCSANSGAERTATVTLSFAGADDKVVTVTQAVNPNLSNIAALTSQSAGSYSVSLTDALVTYVNGTNAYLEDASGAVLLYHCAGDLAVGDKITGIATVAYTVYNNLPEVTAFEFADGYTKTTDNTVTPTEITIAELESDFTSYLSRYVKIVGAIVTSAFSNRNSTIEQSGTSIVLRDQNNPGTLTTTQGSAVTVTAHPSIYNTTHQIAVYEQSQIVAAKVNPTIPVTDTEVAYSSTYSITDIEGGDATVTSSNTSVATVSGLDITPVAVGTTTITVSTAENDTYNAGSATFTLTVTAPAGLTETPTASVGGTIFEEKFSECTSTGGNGGNFATASNTEITTTTINDYTDNDGWSFTKGYPANACVKFGGSSSKGSATSPSITVESGKTYTLSFNAAPWSTETTTMTVTITGGTISGLSERTMTAGEWNEYTASITATSSSMTITFSASKNRFFLDEVKIVEPSIEVPTETYTIPSSGLGTYCSQYPIDLRELPEGVKAYAVKAKNDSYATLTEVTGTVKGGVGLIFEGDGDTEFEFTFTDSENEPNNMLKGTLAPEYLPAGTAYGLKSGVFQPNLAGTIPAHRAYLPANTGSNPVKALTLIFEDDATGITHTRVITDEATIYDLTGRRLNQMQKGINIVNGKKILK